MPWPTEGLGAEQGLPDAPQPLAAARFHERACHPLVPAVTGAKFRHYNRQIQLRWQRRRLCQQIDSEIGLGNMMDRNTTVSSQHWLGWLGLSSSDELVSNQDLRNRQTKPSQAKPSQAKQTKPNQTKPNQTKLTAGCPGQLPLSHSCR